MKRPRLLILDEPFDGLDTASRRTLSETIDGLMKGRMRVILITQRFEEIVPGITHVLYVKDGRLHASGRKEAVLQPEVIREVFGLETRRPGRTVQNGAPVRSLIPGKCLPAGRNDASQAGQILVRMNDVKVVYNGVPTLDGFSWTMRNGENWGAPGAGRCR